MSKNRGEFIKLITFHHYFTGMDDRITLGHGAGGTIMQGLIKNYIVKYLGGSNVEVPLEALDDSAVINDIVLKSDSHTVKPLFFPGGDIGRMAVAGTVNDIAVMGAKPIALTSGFIIAEGFPIYDLERILDSMKKTCIEAGVYVITGDTKVMERESLENLVINTSGIGLRYEGLEANIREIEKYRRLESRWLIDSNLRPSDKILISGTIGDHGVSLLSYREGYGFGSGLESDVQPLNKMIEKLLWVGGVVKMKDPTRGGLSNLLNEWCEKSCVRILIKDEDIPIREDVRNACEMLGIDPLEVGNEGKIALAVISNKAEEVLEELRRHKEGENAAIIGEVEQGSPGVFMETIIGGRRIIPPPIGDPVPRIC